MEVLLENGLDTFQYCYQPLGWVLSHFCCLLPLWNIWFKKIFFYVGSKLPNSQLHNGQPDPRFMGLYSVLFIFHKIATLSPASLMFHKIARWFLITIELLSLHPLSCRRWVSPSLWWSQRQASCSVPYVGDCLSVSHHHPWAHTLWWSLFTFWRNWSSLGQLTCS